MLVQSDPDLRVERLLVAPRGGATDRFGGAGENKLFKSIGLAGNWIEVIHQFQRTVEGLAGTAENSAAPSGRPQRRTATAHGDGSQPVQRGSLRLFHSARLGSAWFSV